MFRKVPLSFIARGGFVLALLAAISPSRATAADAAPTPQPPRPSLTEVRRALDGKIDPLIATGGLVRKDGFAYAIDVGLLMHEAAIAENRGRYLRLLDLVRAAFVIERPPGLSAPVVVWRRRLPRLNPPDASGTTEILQVAHALMVGAEVFQRRQDATLAAALLRGYTQHASVLDGVWLVRNYYNLQTSSFATNSFLIDYGPDLLAHAAVVHRSPKLREVADRSVALIRRATRPNGLIDMLVQPEVKTLSDLVIFSPNDVVELEHAGLIAESVAAEAPDVARGVLRFAGDRIHDLRSAYVASTGAPYGTDRADAGVLSALARLAVRLGDREMIEKLTVPLTDHAITLTNDPKRFHIHVAAQTLLALQLMERWQARAPIPLAGTAAESRNARD
ncbi:MAG TPA: hypothetical protein VGF45_00565 [Polyangia bacterium]